MSAASAEGRSYHVAAIEVDEQRFIQVAVVNQRGQLVTRDHFTVDEGRTFAAEFIVAAES